MPLRSSECELIHTESLHIMFAAHVRYNFKLFHFGLHYTNGGRVNVPSTWI